MEQGSWESFGGRVRFGFVDFGIFPVVLVWPQMNRVSYLLLALGICTAPPPCQKRVFFGRILLANPPEVIKSSYIVLLLKSEQRK